MGDESESEVKTNSGPRVFVLLVEGPHFACVEQGQCPLLTHRVSGVDHQYLNGQHLACKVLNRMYVILNKSRLLFIYKMIQEISSMPRADSGYLITV